MTSTGCVLNVPPLTGPASYDVGWWEHGEAPGQDGPAVFAAHVNSAEMGDLTFAYLDKIKPGALITVEPQNLTFSVTSVQEASKTAFPTQEVYGDTANPQIRLITCGGPFDSTTGHYTENLIVSGVEVSS